MMVTMSRKHQVTTKMNHKCPNKKAASGTYTGKETASKTSEGVPVQFLHSISSSWTIGGATYYRHRVIIKNTSSKPISDLKLVVKDLTRSLWGLSSTEEKDTDELPQWQKVLNPGSECMFVYVHGDPRLKFPLKASNDHF